MNVQQIILHTTGVEVIRKGETTARTLFCPFASHPNPSGFPNHGDNNRSTCCGPWCPHFGDPEQVFAGTYNHQVHTGWQIALSCKGGAYPVHIETGPDGLHDMRSQEEKRDVL